MLSCFSSLPVTDVFGTRRSTPRWMICCRGKRPPQLGRLQILSSFVERLSGRQALWIRHLDRLSSDVAFIKNSELMFIVFVILMINYNFLILKLIKLSTCDKSGAFFLADSRSAEHF